MITEELITLSFKVTFIFSVLVALMMFQSWLLRIISFAVQGRSLNRANRRGLSYNLAALLRSFFKTEGVPRFARRGTFFLAPIIVLTIAVWAWAFVPFADDVKFGAISFSSSITDNYFVLPLVTLLLIGHGHAVVLSGWAANNKFSALSAVRSLGKNLSIDLALLISVMTTVFIYSTGSLAKLNLLTVKDLCIHSLPFVIISGILFFIILMTKGGFHPFKYDSSGREFVADYKTEYSSTARIYFSLAERIVRLTWLSLFVIIFMGGYNSFEILTTLAGPYGIAQWSLDLFSMIVRILLVVGVIELLGSLIPSFKFSRLISVCWDWLFPISILNFIGTIIVHQLML